MAEFDFFYNKVEDLTFYWAILVNIQYLNPSFPVTILYTKNNIMWVQLKCQEDYKIVSLTKYVLKIVIIMCP